MVAEMAGHIIPPWLLGELLVVREQKVLVISCLSRPRKPEMQHLRAGSVDHLRRIRPVRDVVDMKAFFFQPRRRIPVSPVWYRLVHATTSYKYQRLYLV